MENIIYSAIIGNYDTLKEPQVYTPGWRYICFTDNKDLTSEVWTIVQIDTIKELEGLDDIRKARYIKIMFHKMFFSAGITIWHDANMYINCNLDDFVKRFYKGVFTTLSHPDRNCIYKEAIACCRLQKDDMQIIFNQMDHYFDQGYPEENGLAATGILIRELSVFNISICERWWKEIKQWSRRDQLSFNYAFERTQSEFTEDLPMVRETFGDQNYSTIPFYTIISHFIIKKHDGQKL